MERRPWKADNCSTTQHIPSILWNPKFHYKNVNNRHWTLSRASWSQTTSQHHNINLTFAPRSCHFMFSGHFYALLTFTKSRFSPHMQYMLLINKIKFQTFEYPLCNFLQSFVTSSLELSTSNITPFNSIEIWLQSIGPVTNCFRVQQSVPRSHLLTTQFVQIKKFRYPIMQDNRIWTFQYQHNADTTQFQAKRKQPTQPIANQHNSQTLQHPDGLFTEQSNYPLPPQDLWDTGNWLAEITVLRQ